MTHFSTAREAKEFLISKIVAEAQSENVPLSETERKMLYFSETGWTLPDIMEVNEEFEREYDQTEYEKKIARLIRTVMTRARKESPQEFALWTNAIRELKKEDHYILVMVAAARVSPGASSAKRSNNWKVVGQAVVLLSGGLAFVLISHHFGLSMPKSGRLNDTYTTDVRVSQLVGYTVVGFLVFGVSVAVYSYFDRRGWINTISGRILDGVLKLFGIRKDVK